tara:strand:+ start:835 stop:1101 length:267 start_codon:yes stop_codon:yes gene_type:complete
MNYDLMSVLDNGGATFDRYTLSFISEDGEDSFMYGASENPFHPQGFGMYVGDGCFPDTDENPTIGLPVCRYSLPEQVQKLIAQLESDV